MSLLTKMRGDKKGWYKVSDLAEGVEIAVPSETGQMLWDEIVSITPVGREQVYDIEVEGTHNFVGNGIFAHNTYVLRANTMLAVTGEVNAGSFTVPIGSQTSNADSGSLTSLIPAEVLTADGLGVDLYKLATYNLATTTALAARVDADEVRVTSLETRVEKLESGAISSASGSPFALSSSSLASALEGFGILVQKGIAQFNTLVFRQLVASKDADGTSSAGSVTILTGNTVAEVANSLVSPSTKVFVTFNSQIQGSWWVSDKTLGSFRVVLSAPQAGDVSFDYFLVQTEGQIATSSPMTANSSQQTANSSNTSGAAITLLGDNPVHVSVGGVYTDPGVVVASGASVVTYVNGIEAPANSATITTGSETTYIITYKPSDSTETVTRAVIVGAGDSQGSTLAPNSQGQTLNPDTTPPVVTLVGDAALQLTVGDTFTDPGATAADDVDGDLTNHIKVSGAVDTATAGSYQLTYSATDAAGNAGTVSRLVTVVAVANPNP